MFSVLPQANSYGITGGRGLGGACGHIRALIDTEHVRMRPLQQGRALYITDIAKFSEAMYSQPKVVILAFTAATYLILKYRLVENLMAQSIS